MNSGIIGLIIFVSILGGILVSILMESMHEQKELNGFIGQNLTSYTKDELLELNERYERFDYSSIFKKESERLIKEIYSRCDIKES